MTARSAPIWSVFVRKPGQPPEAAIDASAIVTGVTYDEGDKGSNKLHVEINNFTYSQLDTPLFSIGCIVEACWGYPEKLSPSREFTVFKLGGSTSLQVECHDRGQIMNLTQRVRTFTQMRRSDVAAQIAGEYGYTPTQQFIFATPEVMPLVTQARLSDAALLSDMARREGLQWWIDPLGFHFQKRDLKKAPVRKFIYYLDPGAGDIMSAPHIESDITAKPADVSLKGIDPLTKAPINASANNAATKRDGLGSFLFVTKTGAKTLGYQPSAPTSSGTVQHTTEATAASAQRAADGIYLRNQLKAAKISFNAVGDPTIDAKSIIEVDGIGQALSGLYIVLKVKHHVAQHGYTMSITANRDAANSPGGTAVTSDASQNAGTVTPGDDTLLAVSKTGGKSFVFVPAGSVQK